MEDTDDKEKAGRDLLLKNKEWHKWEFDLEFECVFQVLLSCGDYASKAIRFRVIFASDPVPAQYSHAYLHACFSYPIRRDGPGDADILPVIHAAARAISVHRSQGLVAVIAEPVSTNFAVRFQLLLGGYDIMCGAFQLSV